MSLLNCTLYSTVHIGLSYCYVNPILPGNMGGSVDIGENFRIQLAPRNSAALFLIFISPFFKFSFFSNFLQQN